MRPRIFSCRFLIVPCIFRVLSVLLSNSSLVSCYVKGYSQHSVTKPRLSGLMLLTSLFFFLISIENHPAFTGIQESSIFVFKVIFKSLGALFQFLKIIIHYTYVPSYLCPPFYRDCSSQIIEFIFI